MNSKLNNEQIEIIEKNGWVILSTASENKQPHSIIVQPSRIENERIILSNIQMKTSIRNLEQNSKCSINIYSQENDDMQIKIHGNASILNSGVLYEEIKNYEETNNLPPELKVNSIIIVNFENIEVSKRISSSKILRKV